MHDPKWKSNHAVCDCMYTRVPDMLEEIFAVLNFAIFFRIANIGKI